MADDDVVYVVGSGAVGMALSGSLAESRKRAVAVRTRDTEAHARTVEVCLYDNANRLRVPVETVGLSRLHRIQGMVAVTAKAYANKGIAEELRKKHVDGPVVIMQNGVGVEKPFMDVGLFEIYRCVLYLTSQMTGENEFGFHFIKSSPVGIVKGTREGLDWVVRTLSTDRFPFHAEERIQREIWKKATINAVFNSICPLLDVDNGVFVRDQAAAELAREVVAECLVLTDRLGLGLTEGELMEQIFQISKSSEGQLISTLQDIRAGRETEIESLNLEMARNGAALAPQISLPKTELLGKMTLVKSRLLAVVKPGET